MDIKPQLEAILFLGGEDIKIKELAKFFSLTVDKLIPVLYELKGERKSTGINIEIFDDTVYLVSNPKYGEVVTNFLSRKKSQENFQPLQ